MTTQNNNNANVGGGMSTHTPTIHKQKAERKDGTSGHAHTVHWHTHAEVIWRQKRRRGGVRGDEITESKFTPHKHAFNKLKESKMEVRGETKHLKLKINTSPAYPPSLKKKNKKKRKEKVQTQPPYLWRMRGGWRWGGRKTRVELGWWLVASC